MLRAYLRWVVSLVLGILACVAGIVGCSSESQRQVLVLLFDQAAVSADNDPAPVVRSPRRPPPATATPTPTAVPDGELGKSAAGDEPFKTWDDLVRLLPKDAAGNPDFVAALDEKVIAPRPGIAVEAEEREVVALNVDLVPKSDAAFTVTFSHEKHGRWLACPNCHDGLFAKKAGETPITADKVHSEGFCATCHGTVSFDVITGCPLCHMQRLPKDANGGVDWQRALAEQRIHPSAGSRVRADTLRGLDLDVEMKSATQPKFSAVFSHAAHGQWVACDNCHPSLFPKEAAAEHVRGEELHSRRYCGACHGSVAFGINSSCGRCHPAFEKDRQHQVGLDLDVEVDSKSQPGSKAVFSHKIHSQYLECATCHSGVYDVTSAATKMTAAEILQGKYCGACHGKVATDLMSRCQRCHGSGDGQ